MARRALSCIALGYLVLSIAVGQPARAEPSTSDKLQAILAKGEPGTLDLDGIRNMGPEALVELARIYERSNDDMKRRVAHLFYQLGLKSNDAKRALMRDVHTSQAALRLEVQWALGRVSDDDDVVDALVDNMRNDSNPLFRDKAACGLANDQIHLNPRQRARLLRKVIESLASDTPQVRAISLQVLKLQTGQSDGKGFDPTAPPAERKAAVARWLKWMAEYEANL
jgi:hypothetical protein